MDYIIDLLIQLIIDGTYDLSDTKETPTWLRLPLILMIIFILLGTIILIFITGILALKENKLLGILLIIISILLLIYCIYRCIHFIKIRNPESVNSKRWNKFIEQICSKKLKDLNEVQKNAVLCFYYDHEMSIGGHICYFDNYRKVSNEDLKNALKVIANKKYVEIFEEAIEHGKDDNYEKVDSLYKKISPCLTEYLETYVLKNYKDILK